MSIKLLENQKDFTYASQFVFMSFLPTLSLQDNTIFVKPAANVSIKMETDLIKKDTFKTILGLLQANLYKTLKLIQKYFEIINRIKSLSGVFIN